MEVLVGEAASLTLGGSVPDHNGERSRSEKQAPANDELLHDTKAKAVLGTSAGVSSLRCATILTFVVFSCRFCCSSWMASPAARRCVVAGFSPRVNAQRREGTRLPGCGEGLE